MNSHHAGERYHLTGIKSMTVGLGKIDKALCLNHLYLRKNTKANIVVYSMGQQQIVSCRHQGTSLRNLRAVEIKYRFLHIGAVDIFCKASNSHMPYLGAKAFQGLTLSLKQHKPICSLKLLLPGYLHSYLKR